MNESEKQEFKELIKEALKEVLSDAFDDSFGCKHNWVSKGGGTANNYRQCTKCGIMQSDPIMNVFNQTTNHW